ncbi:hypothetical protein THMIRHAS_09560 [Thiosulfatimonas sediminis]|uniref:Uncharacterized protein n=1 Tax=Thiosulfatimonas sediminis TaxID=2675054 RepID=A0A6F8PTW7_9GAMM|nr:hypothetical protein [Thiosulfatimonas sediminis]BBP45583.1 hypothetical protein THMIRHAS_09560 [Thiosulfatimonas sediminis]
MIDLPLPKKVNLEFLAKRLGFDVESELNYFIQLFNEGQLDLYCDYSGWLISKESTVFGAYGDEGYLGWYEAYEGEPVIPDMEGGQYSYANRKWSLYKEFYKDWPSDSLCINWVESEAVLEKQLINYMQLPFEAKELVKIRSVSLFHSMFKVTLIEPHGMQRTNGDWIWIDAYPLEALPRNETEYKTTALYLEPSKVFIDRDCLNKLEPVSKIFEHSDCKDGADPIALLKPYYPSIEKAQGDSVAYILPVLKNLVIEHKRKPSPSEVWTALLGSELVKNNASKIEGSGTKAIIFGLGNSQAYKYRNLRDWLKDKSATSDTLQPVKNSF